MAAQTMSLRPSVMVQRQCAANAKVSSIHTPMVLSRYVIAILFNWMLIKVAVLVDITLSWFKEPRPGLALVWVLDYHSHSPYDVCRRVSLVKDITPAKRQSLVANMGAVEVAQVAGEAGYIGGVAGVMFGITLVGLALGFVLLRVESLAEEGKI